MTALRVAYADPPYPGKAHLYAEKAEVDHAALLKQLDDYDGWALSTSTDCLRDVMSLCPAAVCVGAWIRTNAPPFNPDGRGAVRSWEPLIYSPARVSDRYSHDRVRDVLHAHVPNGVLYQGIPGTKPPAFARWMFSLLGLHADDDFCDLFPGSGAIKDAWQAWRAQPSLLTPALGGRRAGEHPAKAVRESALRIEGVARPGNPGMRAAR